MLAGLLIGLVRNGHAAGDGHRFKPDGDVHAVAEHLVFVRDHIPHVDAETELHEAIRGKLAVPLCHQRLDRDGGLDRPDDARKLQQEAVAGVLHQPAAMIENDRVYRASMGLERGVGAFLVGAHHARIAGDVSADYGCQASFHILPPPVPLTGRY